MGGLEARLPVTPRKSARTACLPAEVGDVNGLETSDARPRMGAEDFISLQ